MGHHAWYEAAGKYLAKRNTFYDFVDCAKHLIATGVTSPTALTCEGRSAGGLLVGNVVNDAPELFTAAIAGVPFVDLMTTMCDPSIPLTTEEWEEWGNPNEKVYYEYMLSYSPIDNIVKVCREQSSQQHSTYTLPSFHAHPPPFPLAHRTQTIPKCS